MESEKVNVDLELATAKKQADGIQWRSVETRVESQLTFDIANDDGRISVSVRVKKPSDSSDGTLQNRHKRHHLRLSSQSNAVARFPGMEIKE
jgi:hypothetical protein